MNSENGQLDLDQLVDATNQAVNALQAIFAEEESLDASLDHLAKGATRAISDAHAATISVVRDSQPQTAAWTNERYLHVDSEQYRAGRGPCLNAARSHRPVRASVQDHRDQWPEFAAAAEDVGLKSYLSVPLVFEVPGRENEIVGSLNLYSRAPEAFDPFDEVLMRLFTTAAVKAINAARRWQQAREEITNLQKALTTRAEIDQAKGILMAIHHCNADEAFTILARQSQQRNVKVNQIAQEFLERVTRTTQPDDRPPDH